MAWPSGEAIASSHSARCRSGPLRPVKGTAVTQVPTAHHPPLLRRPLFWLLLVAALLLAVTSIVLVITLGGGGVSSAASTDAPTSSGGAQDGAAAPASDPAPTSPATPPAVAIPASCDEIYTRDWAPAFAPLVLNPAWTTASGSGVRYGSSDESAIAMLDTSTRVSCKWGNPNGGSDRGLTTNVAAVAVEQAVAMQDHFVAAGYSCYPELEGTRCVIETAPSPDGQSGESHFFREGVWIATLWVNAGPDGYTRDIVAAIFG